MRSHALHQCVVRVVFVLPLMHLIRVAHPKHLLLSNNGTARTFQILVRPRSACPNSH